VTDAAAPSARGGPRGQLLGVTLIILSACGFGSGALFVQPLYDQAMAPQVVLFWRFATAAIFSWAFVLVASGSRQALRAIPARRIGVLIGLGAIYVGNSYAYYASLQVVPITVSSIMTYIYPAVVAVLATRFVRRLEGRRAWVALGLSIVGVTMALGGIPAGELPPLWGLALAVASPIIYGVWIVLQSRVAGDRPSRSHGRGEPVVGIPPGDAEALPDAPHPAPVTAVMTTATAGVYAVIVIATGRSISPAGIATEAWVPLLAIGLLSTAFAIQAFYAGVRRVGGARAALISTIEPVYTIAMAMLLFGEELAPVQVAGGALVIVAVLLAESGQVAPRRPEPTTRQEPSTRPEPTDRPEDAPAAHHGQGIDRAIDRRPGRASSPSETPR
jgi:drug/metabolite transporter (DMT)-like permease